MEEIVKIDLKGKIISLKIQTFDGEVDIENILKIDYSNIMGEILTFSLLMNRIGLLRADQEETTSKLKLDVDIYQAQLQEEKRKTLTTSDTDEKGKTKISKPTIQEVENAVLLDVRFRKKKEKYFEAQKWMSYLDSIYWAAKDKTDKINRLSDKLHPEEFNFEKLKGSINGVMIKVNEKLIKDK